MEVKCPKCHSNQVSADKKGISGKKAVAGAVVAGPIGLLAGTIGSNKVMITCLNCGHQFEAGSQNQKAKPQPSPTTTRNAMIFFLVCIVIAILLFSL